MGDQIVGIGIAHLDLDESTWGRHAVVDQDVAVDLRRLAVVTGDQQMLGLGMRPLDQNLETSTDEPPSWPTCSRC